MEKLRILCDNRRLKIAVVGLGYVGLPTAIAFHESGFDVNGVDISENVIEKLKLGNSPLKDETTSLNIPFDGERWNVTTDYQQAIPESDIVIITVPTPIDEEKNPDLSYVEKAFESVLGNLGSSKGKIVILESTVYPGIINKLSREISLRRELDIGEDFHVAYSPERVSPGDDGKTVDKISKIVGADDPEVGKFLEKLYSEMTDGGCKYVGSTMVAEAAKLIENVQRDVDLALTNEFAIVLSEMGLDVDAVLEASSSKWSFHRHYPGIGVGGHCIPVDPYYYIQSASNLGTPSRIVTIAREINEGLPRVYAERILEEIGREGPHKILVLGFSYKPELGDCRMTPVLPLIRDLRGESNEIIVWDPHVEQSDFPEEISRVENPMVVEGIDAVIIATAHTACIKLDWIKLRENCVSPYLFDGRRSLDPELMKELGWKYSGVGYPQ